MVKKGNIDAGKLTVFVTKALQKAGVPEEDAQLAAEKLVLTDLRGIESHGTRMVPPYVQRIKDGLINPKANIKVFSNTPGTALFDGDRGFGFVVGSRAMIDAMNRAEKEGAGFVSVRNSTHYGAGSVYAIMALSRDMIGISMTTGGAGMVVPGTVGGGAAGINVISFAAPAMEETPFVLDMATTVVAAMKVQVYAAKGMAIPEGWSVDKDGKPITDPKLHIAGGGLLPLGGKPETGSYKGFGLSVMIDILCSALSNSLSRPESKKNRDMSRGAQHFFGALRIDSFIPKDDFKRRIDEMIRTYKALPKAPGVDEVRLAGEIENELEKERRRDGIPMIPSVIESFQKLAKEINIEYDL